MIMAIAELVKVSLAASQRDQSSVLAVLQRYGQCHLIDDAKGNKSSALAVKDEQALEALDYLSHCASQRRALTQSDHFDLHQVVQEVLAVKDKMRTLEASLESTKHRIGVVEPWGDFEFPPQEHIGHLRFWFYILPITKRDALAAVELPWQIVGRSSTRLYVVLISEEEPPSDVLPVERQHVGSRCLNQLLRDREELEQAIDDVRGQRFGLTRYRYLIEKSLVEANNRAFYQHAQSLCRDREHFFTLQFWLPKDQLPALRQMATDQRFAFVSQPPNPEDRPPTLLRPNKIFRAGALLAKIYQMPDYRSWDPSAHLYVFFSLFFAMILSDAGYAMLLGGFLAVFWRRLGVSTIGRELRWLMVVMVLTAGVWGVLVGSYFGVAPQTGLLARLHLLELNHYQTMMQISVLVGVVHLMTANIAAVGHAAHRLQALVAKLGWSSVALGGYGVWLLSSGHSGPIFLLLAKGLIALGLLAVFLASGWRKVDSLGSALQFVLQGAKSLTQVTKLFGDVLSYMRLFALGLASASLAITFNQLAQANINLGGIALVGGILILLFGHLVNLLLAIMGGVVHGLRLNFIEFYNWSEPGEGYPYAPFETKELSHD